MIRTATRDDTAGIVELARRFLATTHYGRLFAYDPQRLDALVGRVLEMGVIFVCEHVAFPSVEAWDRGVEAQHEIVGFIAAVVGVDPFSGQEYADEVAWFVAPDHRHGTAGVRLVEALESWARDKRLGFAKMVAPGEAGSRVAGFLTRRGYHVIETSMIKRL